MQIGLQKCEDAVLQVIGYIPKGGDDPSYEPASSAHGNSLDKIAQDVESEKNDESSAPRQLVICERLDRCWFAWAEESVNGRIRL